MKRLLFVLILFGVYFTSNAKNGYNIYITAPQLANDSIYLAGYY